MVGVNLNLAMECNKEEAVRAKELAEKKMKSKDYGGAQTMLIKAQKLDPSIQNVDQMLTICQVHCSAELKVGSELDWYDILQIEQTADNESIAKKYRKLALQLHPDKNKFPGAEAAFKIIKDAHEFLSDQLKRAQFDMKCKIKQQTESQNQPSMKKHRRRHTGRSFRAELLKKKNPCQQTKDAPSQDCQKNSQVNVQGNRGNVATASQPPTTSGSVSLDGEALKTNANEDFNARVEEESIPPEAEFSGTKNRKRGRNSDSEKDTGSICDMEEDGDHKAGQSPGLNSSRSSRRKHDVSYKENSSDDEDMTSGSRRETTNEPVEKDQRKVLVEESTPYGNAENCKSNGGEVTEDDGNYERPEPVVVEIAHPEFYDFDKDKSAKCFAPDQMWALFDDLDGMPRFYARVDKVDYSPFMVDITWLEFAAGDTDQKAWKRSKLPVACGKFQREITDTIDDRGTFSHKIVCEGDRNTYKIYPRKGETWALYKNWNAKWSSEPNNHREYEYEFVLVMSDYINGSGILVTQLVKLEGFVCLFKAAETNGMSSFQIPAKEMLKFSHRVPSVRTSGRERQDVPEGCFELDPASLPSNLEGLFDSIDVKSKTVFGKREPDEVSNRFDGNPESVLYTFDNDKTEDKFIAGQVWALYCDLDCLPKFYGLIKTVELIPEFKVNIQWLEACTSSNGMLNWFDNTMPVCCGVFSVDNEKEFNDTRHFSHLSKGAVAAKEKYEILPRIGEVWAVYKDFCSEWSSSDLRTCKYDIGKIVQVENTFKLLVLERVGDCETIFKVQRKGFILEIPLHELVRFSHQIPAIRLTDEKLRILKVEESLGGCWELDPKAIPV